MNSVDPGGYHGWDGALRACEADARDMHELASGLGYTGTLLLTRDATAAAVTDALSRAGDELESGDILFVSYSGHGSQVPDEHDEEPDARDETWVLYDRQLVDDELFSLWARFKPGVRIFVLSDSCHSGSVTRGFYLDSLLDETVERGFADFKPPNVKSMPPSIRGHAYEDHKDVYDEIQREHPAGDQVELDAQVILISGCQDNQESLDGDRNGLFTGTLLRVWNGGSFDGDYRKFRRRILDLMPPHQSPNYFVVGADDREFQRQKPWTI